MARAPREIPDAMLRLAMSRGVGPVTLARLLDRFETWDAAATASRASLAAVEGIGERRSAEIHQELGQVDVVAERAAMEALGVSLVAWGDADYPPLLATIAAPPKALWIRGILNEADRLSLAIVGSRRCTAYGREQAGRLGALLAQCGLTIVSGGARGIDVEAHRAALRVNGRTIVVAGCGLSTAYPPEHEELFDRIANESGAIISEFPMAAPPKAEHFPRRNRIISGVSLGVLVIEAARRSGALITARMAAEEHDREVMAVPGRIDSPASAGCLEAIRDGWAALVTSHADVLNQLDSAGQMLRGALEAAGHVGASKAASLFDGTLTAAQQEILKSLADHDGEPVLVDHLAAETQLPMSTLMAELTLLEIRGRVTRNAHGVQLRTPRA